MSFRILWQSLGRRWAGRQRPPVPPRPARRAPRALLLSSLAAAHSAAGCDIEDRRMAELAKEMSDLEILKSSTLICKKCQKRLLIDKAIKKRDYCQCENNRAVKDEGSQWQPFLETDDIVIWRREESDGLYSYKVYGRYAEVRAQDFLAMHTDLAYWRSWDDSALALRTLPPTAGHRQQQDVIHWETEWPRFFANRDYVYVRRYVHLGGDRGDREKLIVMSSQSCDHPDAPESGTRAVRVKRYWSNLIIRPFTDFDQPGIEFSLTYFDDPGTAIPSAMQAWVAGHACPDFLARMRTAAAGYRKAHKQNTPSPAKVDVQITITDPAPLSALNHFATEAPQADLDPPIITSETEKDLFKLAQSDEEHPESKDEPISLKSYIQSDSAVRKDDSKSKSQSDRHTEEFLRLLSGLKEQEIETAPGKGQGSAKSAEKELAAGAKVADLDAERPRAGAGDRCRNVAAERTHEQGYEAPTKDMNYWHIWPLYYFA